MDDASKKLEKLKETILKDYPRMDLDSKFSFSCHPGVSCFNLCCSDVNIFLTPYDVLRMKRRLGITSTEFMNRFTALPIDKNQRFPVILFRMRDDDTKKCHFVDDEKGCTIYEDRPWACRMYPLGLASPKEGEAGGQDFYFLLQEEVCKGHEENRELTVRDWIKDQGVAEYDEMGRDYKDLTLHDFFEKGGQLNAQQMEMFYTACYDLDKFRRFVFESSFLKRFKVDEETLATMKTEDEALLKFASRWLCYCLFGEDTLEVVDKTPRGKTALEETEKNGSGEERPKG
jgi:Fe-S-cluster containining protein